MNNETIARRWLHEVWNERRAEVVDELLDEHAVAHLETGDLVGIAPFKVVRDELYRALPDFQMTIESVIASGDDVAIRWSGEATHDGEALGLVPSKQKVPLRGMTWMRIVNGKIVEGWDAWNLTALAPAKQTVETHLTNQMRAQGVI